MPQKGRLPVEEKIRIVGLHFEQSHFRKNKTCKIIQKASNFTIDSISYA